MNFAKILLRSFIPNFKVGYNDYKNSRAAIPFKTKMVDLFAVVRSAGVYLLFVLLALFLFLFIAPGRDALSLVLEDIHAGNISSLVSLLIGVFIWSVISEFGARYSIYVTDNSGKSLSAERVEWRKFVQRLIAGTCLLLPPLLIMFSLVVIQLSAPNARTENLWPSLAITLGVLYWLLCILANLYFHSFDDIKHRRIGKKWFLSSTRLSPAERFWSSKIYGIYNDFVFILPKPENYLGAEREHLKTFTNYFETITPGERDRFPQDTKVVTAGVSVPPEFVFTKFEDGGSDETGAYRWIYEIPLSFYKILHKQVKWIFTGALIILLAVSFLPADQGIFEFLGAPGLLCGALACWIGIYIGVLYVDFAVLRKSWLSLRFLLLTLLLCSSYFNNDHPVRVHQTNVKRMAFKTHFEKWFTDYKKSFKGIPDSGKYPVVFICAEGGAFRTGAYTAIFLDKLQKKLAAKNIDFKRSVYAMSGVSGGSLGLGFYNAESYINSPSDFIKEDSASPAELFFRHDCLSPIVGKMFYSDLLNLFIPVHINRFDRAIALEDSWEYAFQNIIKPGAKNTFKEDFLAPYRNQYKRPLPLLLINTTEVENGSQCWITNVVPGNIIFARQRDLLRIKMHDTSVNYSTAINFSSRFPLTSPGGMIREKNAFYNRKLHYVDGGYYENTGAASMEELLYQVRADSLSKEIYPVVIYLRFSNSPGNQTRDVSFANEISEIVLGMFNTRIGRTYMAVQQLNGLTRHFNTARGKRENGGLVIDEPLDEDQREVPLDWVLSKQSMDNVKRDVNKKLDYDKGILPLIMNSRYPFPQIKPK
jgi:hypothetical protein